MNKRTNILKSNIYKVIIQILVIVLLIIFGLWSALDDSYVADFEAYCPFGGMQALASFLTSGTLACTMTSIQIAMGMVLIVGIILFSKLFCGYICPLGTISEWLGKIGNRLKIKISINSKTDLLLRSLKYILLFVTFYFTLQSSELFCKKFDPYFAVTSGFNSDVVIVYAVAAILVFVLGSLIFRLFWCKYLCPFGAISNMLRYYWWMTILVAGYLLLFKFIYPVSVTYLLIVTCLTGFILETFKREKTDYSFMRITRNDVSCTGCNLCTRKCPQGIDVANLKTVTHVDCTLCCDCTYDCPEKNTLQINRKNYRWLPAIVLILLFLLGLYFGNSFELPTISQQWGNKEQLSRSATYVQSGIKNIKCYGSSASFANQMREIEGVYGVSTYVSTHTVKIVYDTLMLSPQKLQEKIFIPVKREIREIENIVDSVVQYSLTVDNFFDPLDAGNLAKALTYQSNACGMVTEFGCPIFLKIYFPKGKEMKREELIDLIEIKMLTYKEEGVENKINMNFKVVNFIGDKNIYSRSVYRKMMYQEFSMSFNTIENYSSSVIKSLNLKMSSNIGKQDYYPQLGSHLSNNAGIVAFKTFIDSIGDEVANIAYVDSMLQCESLFIILKSDSLKVFYSDGTSEKVINPFRFESKDIIEP